MRVAADPAGEPRHVAQFYEGDGFLVESVCRFVGPGLRAGGGGVLIASRPHLEEIEARLREAGVDVGAARETGRYATLDADETLAGIMDGAAPDGARFGRIVGGAVAQAAGAGDLPVRVFGELVAVLCDRGSPEAAARVEALWNELARSRAFSVLCGYPMRSFARAEDASVLADVCAAHAEVRPAESYAGLATEEDRLRTIARLQQRAQALEAEVRERRALEAELRRKQAELADLLAAISHELRTPLTVMMGWIRLLRTQGLGAERSAHALEVLERNVRTQARLIDDLLEVSRMATGQMRLEVRPVDVADVVRSVVEGMRPAADAKGVRLEAVIDPSAGTVVGDPDRLQQVVRNLVANAVKYTGAEGRVEVGLARDGEAVTIAVADTGIGIRPDFLPRLFHPFSRGEEGPRRGRSGLGLGLATVRHLVDLHGGHVTAASPGEGRGATFTVTLPVAGPRYGARG